ncbi:MAG: G5 domain-containing protein [Clostridia bacterium]|nr:G5 domain-containing protein [Clostridia bacterium]
MKERKSRVAVILVIVEVLVVLLLVALFFFKGGLDIDFSVIGEKFQELHLFERKIQLYDVYCDGDYLITVEDPAYVYDFLDNLKDKYRKPDVEYTGVYIIEAIDIKEVRKKAGEAASYDDMFSAFHSLNVVSYREETSDVTIPYSTTRIESSMFDEGYSYVKVAGQNGIQRITEEVTEINGEETSRRLLTSYQAVAPVAEEIVYGIRKK